MRLQRRNAISALIAVFLVLIVAGAGGVTVYYLSTSTPGSSTGTHSTTSSSSSSHSTSSTASHTTSVASSSTTQSSTSSASTSQSSTAAASTSTTSTSSTTSTTTTAATTSSTTVSSTSTVCTSTTSTTTTTTTGTQSTAIQFQHLFGNYSEMTVNYFGTATGNSFNITSQYVVLSTNSTTYKVNITQQTGGTTLHYTAWVWKNGTAAQVSYAGYTYRAPFADLILLGAMSSFLFEVLFTSPALLGQFTDASYSHVSSTGSVMLGPTMVSVTNYVANSIPLVVQQCGGTTTLDSFTLQLGQVSGKTQKLLTLFVIKGSLYSSMTGTQSYDFTIKVTSVTKA